MTYFPLPLIEREKLMNKMVKLVKSKTKTVDSNDSDALFKACKEANILFYEFMTEHVMSDEDEENLDNVDKNIT